MSKQERKEQILSIYRTLNEQLSQIDVPELKTQFNREELAELNREIYELKVAEPSIRKEIHELTEQMKKEERPQLLGVYRFPIINEIDFLSQESKVLLDKELAKYNTNQSGFPIDIHIFEGSEELKKKAIEWLIEKDVLHIQYHTECPADDCCEPRYLVFTKKEFLEEQVKYIQAHNFLESYNKLSEEERAEKWDEHYDSERILEELEEYYRCECEENLANNLFVKNNMHLDVRLALTKNPDFSLEKN